ncbi:MAG: magnesium transporter [Gemmatimonadota bacterium]
MVEPSLEEVRSALEQGGEAGLSEMVRRVHPADLADLLERLDEEERVRVFRLLPPELASETLAELEREDRGELLEGVDPGRVQAIFGRLEADDAADILAELGRAEAEQILDAMAPEDSREIAALLAYDEESAGGVMTPQVVAVSETASAAEAIDRIREQAGEVEEIQGVFVVDEERRLTGSLPLQRLITAPKHQPVAEILQRDVLSVRPDADQEEVARLIARYNLIVLPVTDAFGHLLGQITVDDVIDILEAEATEDLFKIGGVDQAEEVYATAIEIVRSRLPWLLVTLLTSFLGAAVVAVFQPTIQRLSVIAVFMPVVAAMAGNSAIQSVTVTVRRLALHGTEGISTWRYVRREISAGVLIGLVIASVLGAVAALWQSNPSLGIVVFGAMWLSISVGALWGALFPILLARGGVDPAVASSVFLTTLTDMLSFLLILGLSTAVLGALL